MCRLVRDKWILEQNMKRFKEEEIDFLIYNNLYNKIEEYIFEQNSNFPTAEKLMQFFWKDTEEGEEFWAKIYFSMHAYIRNNHNLYV